MLGALASVTAAQAGKPTVTNTSTPVSFTALVPCANGGAGELVDFTGSVHEVSRIAIDGNTVHAGLHFNYQGLKGVGQITGDTYAANGSFEETENGDFVNGAFMTTTQEHIHYNGQGSAPNLTIRFSEHLTINANGDVTVFFENFSIDCG